MAEQDLSDWELGKHNLAHDFDGSEVTVNIDGVNTGGVWIQLEGGVNGHRYYTWVPPEVAEAMGTMLLYAAQEWRETHEQG